MRVGEVASKGSWTGNPQGGVKAPDAIVLPNPALRFARTAARLDALADGHPMAGWLRFMAKLAQAQHAAVVKLTAPTAPAQAAVDQAVAARMPPLAADGHRRDPAWREILASLLDGFPATLDQAEAVMRATRRLDVAGVEALADGFLHGTVASADVGPALYVAAALQVYFARLASGLRVETLRLLPQRNLCPCCGSSPVVGVVTGAGATPGMRYLHCSLCATAWNHVRAVCITCGEAKSLRLEGIEGDSGAVKAETCGECHSYAKMLYQAKDMQLDPVADDLASLGLDLLTAEAGWSRHAPNPLLLTG